MVGIRDVTYFLRKTNQGIRNRLDVELKALELTTPQYSLLNEIELSPGLSNAELARKCMVTAQTMNVVLIDLEKRGIVVRKTQPTNLKVKTTALSQAGKDLVLQARIVFEQAEDDLYQGLTADETTALLSALAKIGTGGFDQ